MTENDTSPTQPPVWSSDSAWREKHKMRRGYNGQTPIMYCRECKGEGNTLTKHCVGRMLTDAEERDIEAKRLNFVNGQWVRPEPRSAQPAATTGRSARAKLPGSE